MRLTSVSSSALGTARQIRPHCSAWVALMRSPSKVMPSALARPMRNGILQVEPRSGTIPRLGPKVATKKADSAAMVMSHANARPSPPPAAAPLTRAMVGTGQSMRSRMAPLNTSPASSGSSWASVLPIGGASAAAARSAPAQKPRPAPVTTTTRMLSSCRTCSSAALMPPMSSSFIAFNDSGRFSVRVAMPSSTA